MKHTNHSRRFLSIVFALAFLLCGGYCFFATPGSTIYALSSDGHPETFEEFQDQISDIYALQAELVKAVAIGKEYNQLTNCQELWDILDQYTSTETISHWKAIKSGFQTHYQADEFSYDESRFNELVLTLQKYIPDFQPIKNDNYNILASISNISNEDIKAITYDVLHLGHINLMLTHAQEHFDKNDNKLGRSKMVDNFIASIDSEFNNDLSLYSRIAKLYNRVLEREAFVETQTILQKWQEHSQDSASLRSATYILQHGEQLTSKDYFPDSFKNGFKTVYFGPSIATGIGKETYTLEQLINYLPNHSAFPPNFKKDQAIAFYTDILETETKNLKNALQTFVPTLTNLDSKTVDELLELSEQISNTLGKTFAYSYQNTEPKSQELASTMITLEFSVFNMFVTRPADKYFIQPTLTTLNNNLTSPTKTISAEQIQNSGPNYREVMEYYGRLGNDALQIDPTITIGLYPHPDWKIPETPEIPDTPDNPDTPINPTEPNKPANPEAPSTPNPDDTTSNVNQPEDTYLTPNTGTIDSIVNGAISTLGIIAASSLIITISIKKFFKHILQ